MQGKTKLIGTITGLMVLSSASAFAGDVGVTVNVNVPGIYGQISIGGGLPAPELLVAQPTIVVPARVVVPGPPPEPLYLHVPPGHEKHWAKHCREYNACNRPVYFVSDRWYRDVYTPRHLEEERGEAGRRQDEHERRYEHERERDHEHDHGHGNDHDHGHDHDRDHGDDHDR